MFFHCRSWFEGQELAGKLRAIQTVSCLLQGPSEAGNRVLELEGIMDSILSLCASVREAHQLVAVEALIHAADKAKRASFITANGVSLLKEIYKHSERDSIRIRALVVSAAGREERLHRAAGQGWALLPSLLAGGSYSSVWDIVAFPALTLCFWPQGLCKLGSAGGTDFSMKQFAEGSTMKLAKQCRK